METALATKPDSTRIFNIPSGVPFARALAAQLLRETVNAPERLADYLLLFPTRRAIRIVQDAFLQESTGKALILPQMQSLGDLDPHDLSLQSAGGEDLRPLDTLPPAISPMRRQLLLARLIRQAGTEPRPLEHTLALASALGQFMDQIHTEGLDLKDLQSLVPEDFASHWQITLDFLKILSEHWPAILSEAGVMDQAARRDIILRTYAESWKHRPPAGPVLAAGSTGSIPAAAALLKTISGLEKGRIVLPGLDQDMDPDSWDALCEDHPQFGLRQLLAYIGEDRKDVQLWPYQDGKAAKAAHRRFLATEITRPARTLQGWQALREPAAHATLSEALKGLSVLECAHERDEAQQIAVLIRAALENPDTRIAVITPDRSLSKRVMTACRRWSIDINDSAGQPLNETRAGSFLNLVLQVCIDDFSPVSLLSLLKHPFCTLGFEKHDFDTRLYDFEKQVLRGDLAVKTRQGMKRCLGMIGENHADHAAFLSRIENCLDPLLQAQSSAEAKNILNFNDLILAHIQSIENLCKQADDSLFSPWEGTEGEAVALMLAELQGCGYLVGGVSLIEYAALINSLMENIQVRERHRLHPRVNLLGQLEARLTDADVVIMGGLNEGSWPPALDHDPWMSRPMRQRFGLPAPERALGLAAHDFVQALCHDSVYITRAKQKDGAGTLPARWLVRLEALMTLSGLDPVLLQQTPARAWSSQLDLADTMTPVARPAPCPPLAVRPRSFSVTEIETLLRDPYGLYAKRILGLKKLKGLQRDVDAALRGSVIHDTLHHFQVSYPQDMPAGAHRIVEDILEKSLDKHMIFETDIPYIKSRFHKALDWFINYETDWRETCRFLRAEITGSLNFRSRVSGGSFELKARADRIDQRTSGAAIIDYKSGGSFTKKSIGNGSRPQLALEALILARGGFTGLPKLVPDYLAYWIVNGSGEGGHAIKTVGDLSGLISSAESGLQTLLEAFELETTPYMSLPISSRKPDYNDYEHLARVGEWSVLGDTDLTDGEAL